MFFTFSISRPKSPKLSLRYDYVSVYENIYKTSRQWHITNLHEKCVTCRPTYGIQSVSSPGARPEFVRGGGAQNLKAFFFCFSIFQGGGPAQKIAEKIIVFSTKK